MTAAAAPVPAAVTFDLWHTLVYLEPGPEEAYMAAQVELATSVLDRAPPLAGSVRRTRAELREIFEAVYAEAVHEAQDGRSVPPAVQLTRAAARAGREARPAEYLDGLGRLVAATPFRPAPGGLQVLRYLRARAYRTAVISNTVGEPGDSLLPILKKMGYDAVVDHYEFSDRVPWTKPAPQIFLHALHQLDVAPERTVHVGDGWVDIEGAKRSGLRAGVLYTGLQKYGARYHALFLPPGWSDPPTDYRIDRLDQLPTLLGELLGDGPGA